ncbi:hypothetical protein AMTR_s00101p00151350 [Amborella trichopoda]|uniref:Uncharacterized protein n=1 Tax=Amborella trichopoda TaxID=13333 RepID=W1NUY7_AMBTC|nr:hypothetical protein AMTR_s00101p00151350 [Amborella trichopoda]
MAGLGLGPGRASGLVQAGPGLAFGDKGLPMARAGPLQNLHLTSMYIHTLLVLIYSLFQKY